MEGASVEVGWFSVSVGALRPLTLDPKPVDKKRVSGKDGRFKVRWAPEWAWVEKVAKDGYRYEHYLNAHVRSDQPRAAFKDNSESKPCVIVLRKLEPSSFLLRAECGGNGTKTGVVVFPVDIMRSLKTGRAELSKTGGYCDFFVSANFDEGGKRWKTAFWTTNAHCGLVATTNRQFHAPASGYTNRVEVPQDMYTSPSFTLYLKTRSPQIYAMLPFSAGELNAKDYPNNRYWSFRCGYNRILINPYGRRELEYENAVCRTKNYSFDFESQLKNDALNYILVLKQRAKIPDMPACQKLAGRICDVLYEKSKYQDHNVMVDNQIRELQKEPVKNGKKISKLASTMYSIDLIRELNREFNDLKQQLDAAKLPNDIPDIIPELPPLDVDGSQQRGNE